MKLKLRVDGSTTASELRLLGALFTGLAEQYEPCLSAPVDEAEVAFVAIPPVNDTMQQLITGEIGRVNGVTFVEPVDAHSSGPQFDKPKRTRRTRAEIEADRLAEENSKVAAAEAAAQASNEAALAEIEAAKSEVAPEPDPTFTPAPTQPAPATQPATANGATESPSDTKTYTPAEVQKIAVATAGRFGPEKVKAIIAQYPGAARIADIPVGELAGFVAKLNAVS